MRRRYAALALAATLVLASRSYASTTYTATLTGLNEVPANASTGTGNATCVLDNTGTSLACTVTFSGLVAPLSASHIHKAPAGTNGPIIFPFTPPVGATSGTYSSTFTLTAANVADLNAGLYYVNIHSQAFPGGELRGQLVTAPVPARGTTWGRIKSLFR